MNHQKENKNMRASQKGFSAVEIILVVVFVGLIGAVGWLVYDRQQDNTNTKTETSRSEKSAVSNTAQKEETNTTPEEQTKYLVVKEWGVKFETSDTTRDVRYDLASGTSNTILLTTPRLTELAKATPVCGGADKSTGISRAQIGDDHFGTPWTESELAATGTKAGQYYYYPDGGQPCFGEEVDLQKFSTAIAEIGSVRADLKQLAKTVQAN